MSHPRPPNLLLLALAASFACVPRNLRPPEATEPAFPRVPMGEFARLLPDKASDRDGWATDLMDALEAQGISPSPTAVCSVVAVIDQESGFQADPVVPDLPAIVKKQLDAHAGRLGPVGPAAVRELLEQTAPHAKATFAQRLEHVRTERDLDLVFRDMLALYEARYPKTYATANALGELFTSRRLEDLNPITTAGSMQVGVQFAVELAKKENRDPAKVRDELYTRPGGVHYGTARLLGYETGYDDPLYRFADYNAGLYTSRNAALQGIISRLTGIPLARDGDLLGYDKSGKPQAQDSRTLSALLELKKRYLPQLTEQQLRQDVLLEKTAELEATQTYRGIRRSFEKLTGRNGPYAELPDVALHSPKMKNPRSTAWFARAVNARFEACLGRYEAAGKKEPPA